MFHTASATNYRNLLTQLVQLATGQHLSAVDSIAAGGTGYTVGDVLTLSGGTASHASTVEVLTAPGGVVGSVLIKNYGAYTAPPSDPVSTTGGTGTGCTLNCTFDNTGWTALRNLTQIGLVNITAIVNDGSTYAANDILTVSGGTFVTAATIRVLTVDGGGNILTAAVETPGEYTVAPSSPVSVTGGAGSGATFTLAFAGIVGTNEMILEGSGSGSDQIFVGARTYFLPGPDATNWELAGFTGYVAGNTFPNQPNISPGRYTDAVTNGAYVPLANASMTFWVAITPRRIVMVAKPGSNYATLHMGFLNPFGTSTEFPYPLYICGSTSDYQLRFSSTNVGFSGIADPVGTGLSTTGPGYLRMPGGTWASFRNSLMNGATHSPITTVGLVYPAGNTTTIPTNPSLNDEDEVVDQGVIPWVNIIPTNGVPGTQTTRLKPTPNTTGVLTQLIPSTLYAQDPSLGLGIFGEMHHVYWISAESPIVAEDTLTYNGEIYRIFKSGARGEPFTHFALKEA